MNDLRYFAEMLEIFAAAYELADIPMPMGMEMFSEEKLKEVVLSAKAKGKMEEMGELMMEVAPMMASWMHDSEEMRDDELVELMKTIEEKKGLVEEKLRKKRGDK